jgi:hypothetical protein
MPPHQKQPKPAAHDTSDTRFRKYETCACGHARHQHASPVAGEECLCLNCDCDRFHYPGDTPAFQTSLYDICTCGRPRLEHPNNCACKTFVLARRDPARVENVEICQLCQGEHGEARYAVRLELFLLEDLPILSSYWFLCEHCLTVPRIVKFEKPRTAFRSPQPCDA